MRYWDTITSQYILVNFPENELEIFIELGYPNRSFNNKNPNIYFDHSKGSLIGLEKNQFLVQTNFFLNRIFKISSKHVF